MNIKIKYNNENFVLEMDNSATVKDLKRKIAHMKNCKIFEIRLIYAAEILKNAKRLADLNIQPEKSIVLFINPVTKKSDETQEKEQQNNENATDDFIPLSNSGSFSMLEPLMKSKPNSLDPLYDDDFDAYDNDDPQEFQDYINRPDVIKLLEKHDVQVGLDWIKKGLRICQGSGIHTFDNLLKNLDSIPGNLQNQRNNIFQVAPHAFDFSSPSSQPDYEEIYKEQLKTMDEMGIYDHDKNLSALIQFDGDVDNAMSWLIENFPPEE